MTPIDNLTYNYNSATNRLSTISDATANAAGFNLNGASTAYGYDLNGNYYNDPYKKIVAAKYYFNNLPKTLPVTGGGTIKFTYDASGTKLRKEVLNTSSVPILKQDYVGKIEYKDGIVEAIYTSEGRAVWVATSSSWRYEYNITDHLGNVRAVISDINNNGILDFASGEIINQNAYYPFGLQMNNPALANNTTTPDTKYQYNGKEFNADLGLNLLDYGARWYDASIGRWTTVDPMSESTLNLTPYNYTLNNPLSFIDPDGMKAVYNWESKSYKDDETGDTRSWNQVEKEYGIGSESKSKNAVLIDGSAGSDEAISNIFYSANNSNGSVYPIIAKNSQDAVKQLNSSFSKGDLSNLYIGSHGDFDNASFRIGITKYSSITQKIETKNLGIIGSFVSEKGNFVILSCHTGNPLNGGVELLEAVSRATKRNTFGNQSWGCIGCGNLFSNSVQNGKCGNLVYKGREDRTRGFMYQGQWTKVNYNGGKPISSTITNVRIKNGTFMYD